MQIIEYSDLGVRSARLSLTSAKSNVAVTLFPMVHLGEAAFYKAVYEDASQHDAMLVEGLKSPITTRITRTYRWIAGSRRIGLALQPRHPEQSNSRATIIHADLSHAEFEEHWRKLALFRRLVLYAAAPTIGLYYRWFGSRRSIGRRCGDLDDLPDRNEVLNWSPEWAGLDNAVMTVRDERLLKVMNDYLDMPSSDPRRLAIVYGAHHMRAVLKDLERNRGFRVAKGTWMTVFELERDDDGPA